tara:strand:+ start:156 stop:455 length:300 start_codon:yes stop_codon:yes gene_type:complete
MKQEDLIEHFVNGDIEYIGKKASNIYIDTDYDKDNMTLWSIGIKLAEMDLETEEITIWGWANYYSTIVVNHVSKLKDHLYKNRIDHKINNEHPHSGFHS